MKIITKALAVTTDIQDAIIKDTAKRGLLGLGKFFKYENIGQMVRNILIMAMSVSAVLALLFLIWGAIDLIASQGDKQQYESARNKITYAVVGLAIVAAAWAAWYLMTKFFGIGERAGDVVKFVLPE